MEYIGLIELVIFVFITLFAVKKINMFSNIRQLNNKEKMIDFLIALLMVVMFLIQLGQGIDLQEGKQYGMLTDSVEFLNTLFNNNIYILQVFNILFLLVPSWILWAISIKLVFNLFLNYNLQSYYCIIAFLAYPNLYNPMIWNFSECVVNLLISYICYMLLCILKMGITKKKIVFAVFNILILLIVVSTAELNNGLFITLVRNIIVAFCYALILKYAMYLRVTLRKISTVVVGGLVVVIQLFL